MRIGNNVVAAGRARSREAVLIPDVVRVPVVGVGVGDSVIYAVVSATGADCEIVWRRCHVKVVNNAGVLKLSRLWAVAQIAFDFVPYFARLDVSGVFQVNHHCELSADGVVQRLAVAVGAAGRSDIAKESAGMSIRPRQHQAVPKHDTGRIRVQKPVACVKRKVVRIVKDDAVIGPIIGRPKPVRVPGRVIADHVAIGPGDAARWHVVVVDVAIEIPLPYTTRHGAFHRGPLVEYIALPGHTDRL